MSEERSEKNTVFTPAPPNVHQGIETTTAVEQAKIDFGLDIPNELVPLPSQGKTYPPEHPLFNKDTVEITTMTSREEDILTSPALIKKGTVITELIKSCLVDKRINVDSLLAGDRNALMVAIRVTGYGADYEGNIKCTHCGEGTDRKFDLASLEIQRLDIAPCAKNENEFEFTLPRTKATVRFRFMTGNEENQSAAEKTRKKRLKLTSKIETNVSDNLFQSVISINGVTNRPKIRNFISKLPAQDSRALRNYIKDSEPGIVLKSYSICDACDEGDEVTLPMGVKFLWPDA